MLLLTAALSVPQRPPTAAGRRVGGQAGINITVLGHTTAVSLVELDTPQPPPHR